MFEIPYMILMYVFLFIGGFFNLLGAVGVLRFPDVYTRLHAGTKCTTFGSIFIAGAVMLLGLNMWIGSGNDQGSVLFIHTAVALVAILLTNPTGAHAIAQAAHRSGILPKDAVVDDLKGRNAAKKTTTSKKKEVKK